MGITTLFIACTRNRPRNRVHYNISKIPKYGITTQLVRTHTRKCCNIIHVTRLCISSIWKIYGELKQATEAFKLFDALTFERLCFSENRKLKILST